MNEHPLSLGHQFEDLEQQKESYIVGMWAFLVTEILFFGALFTAYIVYRAAYPKIFALASHELNITLGGFNTFVLLTSSWTMALAVRAAIFQERKKQVFFLLATMAFAAIFLIVKYFEYGAKIEHHLFPGASFHYEGPIPADQTHVVQIFFSLYFAMTGLHGLHVLVGFLVIGAIVIRVLINKSPIQDYIPTELVGLYWHFVDIVWIFLYPLLYLIDVHR